MRKVIALILILATAFVTLTGCLGAETAGPAPQELGELSAAAETAYKTLEYAGIAVNPQNYYSRYTVDDGAFIAEVWNAARYDEWTARDAGGMANADIALAFLSDGGGTSLTVDYNDVGARIDADDPQASPLYFDVPAGTYQALSAMLIEYTAANFNGEITPQVIFDLIANNDSLAFASGEVYFRVDTAKTGCFADEWNTGGWKAFTPEDGPLGSETITIHNNTTDIVVALDTLVVAVTHVGRSKFYEISQETADVIKRQFDEFRAEFSA